MWDLWLPGFSLNIIVFPCQLFNWWFILLSHQGLVQHSHMRPRSRRGAPLQCRRRRIVYMYMWSQYCKVAFGYFICKCCLMWMRYAYFIHMLSWRKKLAYNWKHLLLWKFMPSMILVEQGATQISVSEGARHCNVSAVRHKYLCQLLFGCELLCALDY